jgi:manganese/iron transport system permease protein
MMDLWLMPFQFPFMQNAFLIMAIIAVPAAMLSCFLVLKGWALMGDAISHAVLPGIVLAYIAGLPLLLGAFLAGLACALSTGFLAANSRIKQDTAMGVVFSGMFGLGLVLYAQVPSAIHLDHILFGNMLGITPADLRISGVIALIVTLVLLVKRHDFMLMAFDPLQARALGLKVSILHYGLLVLIALTIVAVLSAVGIILAVGLLIAPGAIAYLLTDRFGRMLALAVVIALGSGMLGIWASFHLDAAPAPTIILVLTALFIAVFLRHQRRVRPQAD